MTSSSDVGGLFSTLLKKWQAEINLPDDHIISMLMAIGKQIKPAMPRGGQLPLSDIVFTDGFSS